MSNSFQAIWIGWLPSGDTPSIVVTCLPTAVDAGTLHDRIARPSTCTVHVDGRAVRSCSVPARTAVGKKVVTIEGVSADGSHPIQAAWKEFDAPQCGYCQSGMIMSALALLRERPTPSDADIDTQVTNICRCGTYHRVRQAIHLAADLMKSATGRV